MTVKAKASMLGELGGDLEWTERLTDKDWSHYYGKQEGDTVVVFCDGIEVSPSTWWLEGLKGKFGNEDVGRKPDDSSPFHAQSRERRISPLRSPKDLAGKPPCGETGLLTEDLWGSSAPLTRASSVISRNTSRSRQPATKGVKPMTRSMSTPRRLTRYLDYDQRLSAANDTPGYNNIASTLSNTRQFVLGSQIQCLSPASMNSSMSNVTVRRLGATGSRPGQAEQKPDRELQRKTNSPSGRRRSSRSRKHVNWNDRSTI